MLSYIMLEEIKEVENVVYAAFVMNENFVFDHITQLPPMSFRVIVKGGNKKHIARIIYKYRPLGILSTGNTRVKVKGVFGMEHYIRMERVK